MATTPEAREVMARVYATRESIGAAIDQVLTAKVLGPKDREQVIEDSLRGAPQAKAAWPRTTSLEDITRDVAAIDGPTVVIAGELDRVDSVDLLKTELLSRVPHAMLQVLPGTGHLSPLESPQELGGLISDFAAQIAGEPNGTDGKAKRAAPRRTRADLQSETQSISGLPMFGDRFPD
jgi:pimeloyl-ACP methyl ester carboxylesterase